MHKISLNAPVTDPDNFDVTLHVEMTFEDGVLVGEFTTCGPNNVGLHSDVYGVVERGVLVQDRFDFEKLEEVVRDITSAAQSLHGRDRVSFLSAHFAWVSI